MKKRKKDLSLLPSDTYFFTFPLNQNMIFTKEILKKYYEPLPRSTKGYYGRYAEYLDFQYGMVKIAVTMPGEKISNLYIHVNLEEMHVACDCKMPGGKLCRHGYFGLNSIMWQSDSIDLKEFYWPHINVTNIKKNKYLNIKLSQHNLSINPNQEFGDIYKGGIGFKNNSSLKFTEPLSVLINHSNPEEVIGYAVMYSGRGNLNSHLPYFMPFTGVTNKGNKEIGVYKQFIKKQTKIDYPFTDEQLSLNDISFEMFSLVRGVSKLRGNERELEQKRITPIIINLWKQAIEKLKKQQNLKAIFSYGFVDRDRPRKSDVINCKLINQVYIDFILKDKGEYFSLEPKLIAENNDIKLPIYKSVFALHDFKSDDLYLLSSVQDEKILNWLSGVDYKLTIFKQDFQDFHERFLSNLTKSYRLFFQLNKSKQIIDFNYDAVLKYLPITS
jgi:hypothetical protein